MWVTSMVLLWVAVIAQGVIIVALLRQVGSLLIRVAAVPSTDAGFGPEIGEPAPWMPHRYQADLPLLLAFVSTDCGTCDAIVPALNALASSYREQASILVIASAKEPTLMDWVRTRRLHVPAISAPAAMNAYEIEGTPYVFVIDVKGQVAARGGVNHIEHLEDLLRRCTLRPTNDVPSEELIALGAVRDQGTS
jgi:methylamine dehydrogenase accessory protein MauD